MIEPVSEDTPQAAPTEADKLRRVGDVTREVVKRRNRLWEADSARVKASEEWRQADKAFQEALELQKEALSYLGNFYHEETTS